MAKAKAESKEEDVVYVGIEDPVSVRKSLLEASKSVVHVLKGQHNLSAARAAKHKLIEELRGKMTHLNALVAEARQMLPHMDEASLPVQKHHTVAPSKQATTKPKAEVTQHLDKFESELNDIEKKLHDLS